MALHFNRHFLHAAGLAVIVLLTVQSCRDAPSKTEIPAQQKEMRLHLIDSLLPLCRLTFDSARKDLKRKDILVRGQQLMRQTERLAEAAQYKLDTLAKVVELQARATRESGDSALALKHLAYARDIYNRTGNKKSLAAAYFTTGAYFIAEKDTTELMAHLDSAAQISLVAQDTTIYFRAMLRKARVFLDVSRDDKYLQTLVDLLAFQRSKFPLNISVTAFSIGGHYQRAHNDTMAFKYYIEAIENLPNDSSRIYHHSEYYVQVGYIYYDMGNYQEARKIFDKTLELASKPGNEHPDNAAMAISWIESCFRVERKYREGIEHMKQLTLQYPPSTDVGRILMAQNMLELYMLDGQYAKANQYADELRNYLAQGRIPGLYQQFTHEITGKLYMFMGRLDEAKAYLLKAHELAENANDLQSMAEDARQLFAVDSLTGKYLDAIAWFQKYKSHLDTRRSRMHTRDLRELDIKYATTKRIDSLKTLTERTSLQQSLIQQTSFSRNLFVTMAILLVVILAILFGRYRLKQRVNKQLQDNQQKINEQNHELEKLVADERKLSLEKTQLLVEKEWLLKEVHHRVKNNLQIMMSLLELQSTQVKDDALLALEDSQRRIYAMSLIHQKLYQSDDIKILDMSLYLREFVSYLKDSFDISNRIHFTFNLQPVELSVTQAIPIALIANEAITNSFKYAFPENRRGEIDISLTEAHDDVEIQLADNGIGMPQSVLEGEGNSLGMELMKGLTTEINGTISFDTTAGTRVIIRFKRKVFIETQYYRSPTQ